MAWMALKQKKSYAKGSSFVYKMMQSIGKSTRTEKIVYKSHVKLPVRIVHLLNVDICLK